ncbi:uncharacterized protein J8A68_000668 [[Candida] subhashii]|uniref:GATA-type domain-containing protein n=1 Tax=[Candida] subhashii TaxID=561895 RepID=A0A8J5QW55_9ASCO|nr:uncharacterized protein J8A68_000668 [[Candida] subhashii]KAG7665842.1 hypothetical protein J8A68_000668 [[Candida] subhashii]
MSSEEDNSYKRMQIKVLYSFNNNPTVFLSRSKIQYSVKTAQLPLATSMSDEPELITLGAFDLKNCVQQIIKSSPENFKLHAEDYAVYYKDITEQPDEPFVSSGVLSSLINTSKAHLIPGRVCQNVSASFLFGDKTNASSLTLEIRLKLHTIDGPPKQQPQQPQQQQMRQNIGVDQVAASGGDKKRIRDSSSSSRQEYPQKRFNPSSSSSASSLDAAVKATRTKSLPSFPQLLNNPTMLNIRTADRMNNTSRYDNKSVQDRFKSAPFFQAKIVDKPVVRKTTPVRRYHDNNNQHQYQSRQQLQSQHLQPARAMRTRSMVNPMPLMISSPILEGDGSLSDSTDDTEYREDDHNNMIEEHDEEEEEEEDKDFDEGSPYTPQQPPYEGKSSISHSGHNNNHNHEQFQSLPDLEELDSKRIHSIPPSKLSSNHGLVCVNHNCATQDSITWRFFETEFRPNYFNINKSKKFDKNDYDGMFGPLCNACFLFLRNKGFMRPEHVVKKYLQQQRYKSKKDEVPMDNAGATNNNNNNTFTAPINKERSNSLNAIAVKRSSQFASSPVVSQSHGKFATPAHTPSAINQVIQNRNSTSSHNAFMNNSGHTPNYQEISDIMNQISNFGGPLTDIDPLPYSGVTPPMIATKSNTRVINLYEDNPKKATKANTRVINLGPPEGQDDDSEDKENCPPPPEAPSSEMDIDVRDITDFENMIIADSFTNAGKSSPLGSNQEWMNALLAEQGTTDPEPTPNDQEEQTSTPGETRTPVDLQNNTNNNKDDPKIPVMKSFINRKSSPPPQSSRPASQSRPVVNMPSSPYTSIANSEMEDTSFGSKKKYESDFNQDIESLVSGSHRQYFSQQQQQQPSEIPHSSSSPNQALRADTNNSIMSWNNTNTMGSGNNKSGHLGSTPNTEFNSNDDVDHDMMLMGDGKSHGGLMVGQYRRNKEVEEEN